MYQLYLRYFMFVTKVDGTYFQRILENANLCIDNACIYTCLWPGKVPAP